MSTNTSTYLLAEKTVSTNTSTYLLSEETMSMNTSTHLPEGHQFYEYEILRVLGQGGFGVTYLAMDTHLNKKVAIKEFFPRQFSRREGMTVWPKTEASGKLFAEWKGRFLDEARILALFQHPHIVRVLRYFEFHGTAYMVMEFEAGSSLNDWVKGHGGRVSEAALLRLLKPLLSGLDKMHKAQILHRDIKPDNIFTRNSDGMPVLLDFGAARQSISGHLQDATVIYTPGFAPVEQYADSHFDQGPWTDIYALACVLYWVVTGKPPQDSMVRWVAVTNNPDPLIPLTAWQEHGYQESFLKAVEHGLCLHPLGRPQSISQWQAELFGEHVLRRVYISAPRDVIPERVLAQRVVDRLHGEFGGKVLLEAVYWEQDALCAAKAWKTYIKPSQSDIMVVILGSRLESETLEASEVPLELTAEELAADLKLAEKVDAELPAKIAEKTAIKIDDAKNNNGTEWEFIDAVEAHKVHGRPDLLIFRKKIATIQADLENWGLAEQKKIQLDLVDEFTGKWCRDETADTIKVELHTFEHPAQFEDLFEGRLYELIKDRFGPTTGNGTKLEKRWTEGSPFRGLESFNPEHAPVFYGRTQARSELREILVRRIEQHCAFVLVLGASGSGKSSLVKAGLLPDLMTPGVVENVALCRYAIMRPSDNPTDLSIALAAAILSKTGLPELSALAFDQATLADSMSSLKPNLVTQPFRLGLHKAGETAHLRQGAEVRLLIIVDQFEELFTLEGMTREHRTDFVDVLASLTQSGLVWVVATMRSDFFHHLETLPGLKTLAPPEARYPLAPPTPVEIGQMIRHPAREAGLRYDTDPETQVGLDDCLQEATARDGASLPLLSFTLEELWNQRTNSGILTYAAYKAMGELQGSLGRKAEKVFSDLQKEQQLAFASVMRKLVTVGGEEGGRSTARTVALAQFGDGTSARQVVEAFLSPKARLLVVDDEGTGAQVRVVHEALLSHWERAKNQIKQDRSDLQLRGRLEQSALRWRVVGKTARQGLVLPSGLQLQEARDLLKRWASGELESGIVEYVKASITAHRWRRGKQTVMGLLLLLTLPASYGVYWGVMTYLGVQDVEKEMTFVSIPKGCYQMGSPETEADHGEDEKQHEVCVENFDFGKFEVTQWEWARVMHGNPSQSKGDKNPVEMVSWYEAVNYTKYMSWFGKHLYQLPTEAEWEYAARGGTTTLRYWGNGEKEACQYANVMDLTGKASLGKQIGSWFDCHDEYPRTAPVDDKKRQSNAFGLNDVLGNVWEWTCSEYAKEFDGLEKECAKTAGSGSRRVRRGGGWMSDPASIRTADRNARDPSDRSDYLGLRLTRRP